MKTGKRARALALELAHVETGSISREAQQLSVAKWSASGVLRAVLPPPIVTAYSGGRPQTPKAGAGLLELEGRHQLLRN